MPQTQPKFKLYNFATLTKVGMRAGWKAFAGMTKFKKLRRDYGLDSFLF